MWNVFLIRCFKAITGYNLSRYFLILICFEKIIKILLEDSPYNKWQGCKHQIIRRNIVVIEECLTRVSAIESEYKLRDSKKHILIEEVKNHLRNSDIIPPPMDQQQPP